jgi:hypothetical protein
MRPTIAHLKIQEDGSDSTPPVQTLASLDKEFAGALDKANPIEPERALAAGVLRQAANDLRRFHESEDAVGREMYWDARSWFLSNDTEWPYSFLNVCHSLGIAPENIRDEVFADARSGWLSHSAVSLWRRQHSSSDRSRLSFRLVAVAHPLSDAHENTIS